MKTGHSVILQQLARELLGCTTAKRLSRCVDSEEFDVDAIVEEDSALPGLGIHNIEEYRGRLRPDQRDLWRPVQYFRVYFAISPACWHARTIVETCGLLLEGILKRVSGHRRLPLGAQLDLAKVRRILRPELTSNLRVTAAVHNLTKHDLLDTTEDGHTFSPDDAVAAYFICRVLSHELHSYMSFAPGSSPPWLSAQSKG